MIYTSYDSLGFEKVLDLLKNHNKEYLSGQDLSDVLKISRVAVWKHIKKIRSLGYEIESKQKLGYRLVRLTKFLLPWEITDGIKTKWIGKRIYYFDSLDSTQNYALKIASEQKENGTVVIAKKQTQGRGRMNRKWVSPNGGIWLSIILHPKVDFSITTLFPIATSIALSDAIEKTLGIKSELKWPNDVMIKGKKVAGILIDVSLTSNHVDYIVIGVGINFDVNPSIIEKTIKNTDNFSGVTNLIQNNAKGTETSLVQSFLFELEKIFGLLKNGNEKLIIKNWTKKNHQQLVKIL